MPHSLARPLVLARTCVAASLSPQAGDLTISHRLFSAVACFEVIFYELLVQIYGLISF